MYHFYNYGSVGTNELSWKEDSLDNSWEFEHEVRLHNEKEEENVFTIAIGLDGSRKSTPNVSESYLDSMLDIITKELKSKKGYVRSNVSLSTIDYYTDEVYPYEVPYVSHSKGKRKNTIGQHTFYSIPKDWQVYCQVVFEGELSMRMRNSIIEFLLSQLNVEYDSRLKRKVKKSEKEWAELKVSNYKNFYHSSYYGILFLDSYNHN